MKQRNPWLCAGVVLAISGTVPAQDTVSRQDPFQLTDPDQIPIPTEVGAPRVVDLTLERALTVASESNVDLQALGLLPGISAQDLLIARAFYDSEIYSDAGHRKSENPSTSPFLPEVERTIFDARLGWRRRVVTGGLLDVNVSALELDQTVSVSGFPSKLRETSVNASITQPLLRNAGVGYGNVDIERARAAEEGAKLQFEQNRQDILLIVVQSYWELVFAREDYKVQFQAKELADRQLEITDARIQVRDLAPRDRVADEAEVARRQEALILADNLIRQREDELRALLFGEGDTEMWEWVPRPTTSFEPGLDEVESLDWQEVARTAIDQRPDIARLREDIAIAEQNLLVAQTDLWPQLDLVGSYNSSSSRVEGFSESVGDTVDLRYPDWSIRLQFSYPLGNRAAWALRDRAELTLEEVKRRLIANEIVARRDARNAVRNLQTLSESIRASQKSVDLGQSDWETAVAKERAGTLTKFDVMERNQQWSEARSRHARNQIDFRVAEAVLDHVQGKLRPEPDGD